MLYRVGMKGSILAPLNFTRKCNDTLCMLQNHDHEAKPVAALLRRSAHVRDVHDMDLLASNARSRNNTAAWTASGAFVCIPSCKNCPRAASNQPISPKIKHLNLKQTTALVSGTYLCDFLHLCAKTRLNIQCGLPFYPFTKDLKQLIQWCDLVFDSLVTCSASQEHITHYVRDKHGVTDDHNMGGPKTRVSQVPQGADSVLLQKTCLVSKMAML